MLSSDLEVALQTISRSSPGKLFCYLCIVSDVYANFKPYLGQCNRWGDISC